MVEAYIPITLMGLVPGRLSVIKVRRTIPWAPVGEINRLLAKTRLKDTSVTDDSWPGRYSLLRDSFGNATGRTSGRKYRCSQ